MATSGTVGQTILKYNQRKIIDHAARRAGFRPEDLSAEDIEVAQDGIFTLTSEWINAGYPLWTREFRLYGPTIGSADVPMIAGTVDVIHSYWRILQPWRGGGATVSGGAGGNTLFTGMPGPDITIPGPDPAVQISFGSPTEVDTIGILLGGSSVITTALQIWTSPTTAGPFVLLQTLPSTTFTPGQWQYFTLVPSAVGAALMQIINPQTAAWVLNQITIGLSQSFDQMLGELNADMYYNLPDKQMLGEQPNSAFIDRKINPAPVLKIWPVPNVGAFYNGCISVLQRRYIQDPGTLANNIEVPQRWLEALQWRLATVLVDELPERSGAQENYITIQLKQQRIQRIEQKATKSESLMWAEERTRGPIQLTPQISGYTK